jgi:hypothetical protein
MSNRRSASLVVLATVVLSVNLATAQQHDMPAGMSHEQHLAQMKKQAEMKKRGNEAMGFDQDKTTHHFWLSRDGGMIQVETNDAEDTASRDLIRSHLKSVSEQFAKGDFSAPFRTHTETPPGVPAMQRMKSEITYVFEEKPQGAVVRIKSTNREAVTAVHDFLQYQIREHATGDPVTVTK